MFRTWLLSGARCSSDADRVRFYQDLFDRLDTNKDGKVDVAELREGLKAMGMYRQGAAQVTRYKGILLNPGRVRVPGAAQLLQVQSV